jgi:hypothetical protein
MYSVELHYSIEQQACLFAPSTNKFEISWHEPTKESREKVEKICRKAGFLGKIIAIHQPSGSAEINSQNFRISLESGQTFLLRCCRKFSGRERYIQLNTLFQLLQKTGISCPEIASIDSEIAYLEEDDVVEENYELLKDQEDVQNIHFDLNSTNFLVKDKQVFIMDFDNLSLGNVYTDIAFVFHRLITTCIQQGEKDVGKLVHAFLRGYKAGNSHLDFRLDKLIVAAYNRALWNIHTNLSLKYEKHSVEWLTSIPVNITRLKQVEYLTSAAKTLEQGSNLSTQSALGSAISKKSLQSKIKAVNRRVFPALLTKVIVGLAFVKALTKAMGSKWSNLDLNQGPVGYGSADTPPLPRS